MKPVKWVLLFNFVVFHCFILWSQQVVSMAGNYGSNGSYSLSWTLGEPVISTLTNGNILTQGFQQPENKDVQVIPLFLGWSIISTYIYPVNPLVPAVMAQITPLILAKNGNGNVYWPQYGVNNIGNLIIDEGYQVKMQATDTLVVTGVAAVPQNTGVSLPSGWSIMSYLRKTPASVELMLGGISSYIILVKNGDGNVYWPEYGVNIIGNLAPGKGYQIKMMVPRTFYYQANSESMLKDISLNTPSHYSCHINTGNNMTLCIPDYAWTQKPQTGDEIGIMDMNGQLVGSGVYQGDHLAFPVWGTDQYFNPSPGMEEGSAFSILLWNHITSVETKLEVAEWKEGNDRYEPNGISIVNKFRTISYSDQLLLKPNPAKEILYLDIMVTSPGKVNLSLIDDIGMIINTVTINASGAGLYSQEMNVKTLPPGHSTIRMSSTTSEITKDLIVIH